MGIEMGNECDMAPERESLRRTWRCSVCDALHVDDGGSILHAIPWDRHAHVGASRRRWIDAAVSVLDPEWNGSPDDLGPALLEAIAAAERRGYERGVREAFAEAQDAATSVPVPLPRRAVRAILGRIGALLDGQPGEEG